MGRNFNTKDNELYKRIDEVLHYIWDPIGVADIPQCRDEYRSYLPKVYQLVKSGTKDQVIEYLTNIDMTGAELMISRSNSKKAANIMFDWKDWIEQSNV